MSYVGLFRRYPFWFAFSYALQSLRNRLLY